MPALFSAVFSVHVTVSLGACKRGQRESSHFYDQDVSLTFTTKLLQGEQIDIRWTQSSFYRLVLLARLQLQIVLFVD